MKKIIYRTITVFGIMLILCSSTNAYAKAKEPVLYLALGDSITNGYIPGGSHFSEECFTQQIASENHFQLINKAVDGNTASGILDQLHTKELDQTIESAQLITITCGGNDLLASLYRSIAKDYNNIHPKDTIQSSEVMSILSSSSDSRQFTLLLITAKILANYSLNSDFQDALTTFIHNLNEVTAYIHDTNPKVQILVATQYNPYHWFTGYYEDLLRTPFEKCVIALNDSLKKNASEGNYQIVDVYTAFHESETRLCNATESPLELDFHPNADGHKKIADTFQTVIQTLHLHPSGTPAIHYVWIICGILALVAIILIIVIRILHFSSTSKEAKNL